MVMNDQQIQNEIELRLSLDSRIDDSKIRVDVNNGVVTLVGTVPSPDNGMIVVGLASNLLGVLKVVNHLGVDSSPAKAMSLAGNTQRKKESVLN